MQIEAIQHGLAAFANGYRYVPEGLPVGVGKSLVAMGLARKAGVRSVILTATKGLQDQYGSDFEECGLVDIRGRNNYPCRAFRHPPLDCRIGALEGCPHVDGGGCTYEVKRDEARIADTVVTNYSYWFHVNERQPALGDVGLLILDEAHCAMEQLSDYIQVEVRETWLRRAGLGPAPEDTVAEWQKLALNSWARVNRLSKEAALRLRGEPSVQNHRVAEDLGKLSSAFEDMMSFRPDLWVLEAAKGTDHGRTWTFDSVWPANYSSQLFQCAPRVMLMSGTIRPATMKMLGVKPTDYEFREWPGVFPAQNTPVSFIPTVWVNKDISEEDLDIWVERIDEIIDSRLDRKGLIHTVSYPRQEYLYAHSRHKRIMDCNKRNEESEDARVVFQRFKQASAPRLLVSPSFSTGWDFPGRDCEYIIIAKVPYKQTNSPVIMARDARVPTYSSTLALQDMVQSAYRGTRFETDRCEVFIVDNCYWGLMKRVGNSRPMYFNPIQRVTVPPAGPRAPEKTS